MPELSEKTVEKTAVSNFAFATFLLLETLVIAQAIFAYRDHILTVSQMRQRGIEEGLPFVWHFAMWSDLLIISPLAGYLVAQCFRQWSPRQVLASLAIGFIVSGILHWFYTLSTMPQAHVQNHALTPAGYVHFVYMGLTLAVFAQFLFFMSDVPTILLRVTSVLLFIHVFIGTHMVLGILSKVVRLDWYPARPLLSIEGWVMVALTGIVLLWRNL